MIAFRQIRPDDFTSLGELSAEFSIAVNLRATEDWKPAGICTGWVACANDDRRIGAVLACRATGELLALIVHPEFQNKRVGGELLRQAEAWLFSHGWLVITATSKHISENALLNHGWSHNSETPDTFSKTNPAPTLLLEEHWIEDSATGYGRLVRLKRGPQDKAHPLCLVLDGETYWRDMEALPIFQEFAASLATGMTLAFVGHVSAVARHHDFIANEQYAHFIGEKVVPWLQQEVTGLKPQGHVVVGLSLSGLMAVHLALRYPQAFSACISQSGSHWWHHDEFQATVEQHAPVNGRFWLSVGNQEIATNLHHPPTGLHQKISQIEGVRSAVNILRQFGGIVYHHEFDGSHSTQCWKQQLPEALRWCMNAETAT